MYDDVLFPTDGSDATQQALRHALDITDRYGATLHVLSVINEGPYRATEAASREAAERTVKAVSSRAQAADVETETAIHEGAPNEEILSYADEHGVDMIVMGTHGRTGIGRAILGSVTEQVIRTADVPVVTVRSSNTVSISDTEEAEEIALEELRDRGYEDVTVVDEPYRTSGSWIVPVRGDDQTVHVHVDAVAGTPHVARIDDD